MNLKEIIESQYTDQVGFLFSKALLLVLDGNTPPTHHGCAYLHCSVGDRGGGGMQKPLTLTNVPNTLKSDAWLLLANVQF